MQVPVCIPHHLLSKIKEHRLTLWQINQLLGGKYPCEAELSKMLRGIKPMPVFVEKKLSGIIAEIERPAAQSAMAK